MNKDKNKRICPVEYAAGLDNKIRRIIQNPNNVLKPHIKEGMTVLDLGCGPGYFTIEIARMLNNTGKVIAADLQKGMFEKLRQKIKGTALESNIIFHQCQEENIGITEKIDFILAFYMIHEVPNHDKLFQELYSILQMNGRILIVEPMFHVSGKSFENMLNKVKGIGFEIIDRPKSFLNRSVILVKKK